MNESNLNEITTKDLFDFLQENMVVKEEFNEKIASIESRMATKDDIAELSGRVDGIESRMATKDDLERFATKGDLAGMETRMVSKSYLDDKLSDLGAEIGARINRKIEREQEFKRTLIHILRSHALVGTEELTRLEGFV